MQASGDVERAREAWEQAYGQANHYARIAARLLYDGREADARLYAARYARAMAEAYQLHIPTATARQTTAEAQSENWP